MPENKSLVEKWVAVAKRHPISGLVLFLGAIVIGIAEFTNSIDSIAAFWKSNLAGNNDPRHYNHYGKIVELKGGNGLSISQAISIENALHSDAGICAEHHWIRQLYPNHKIVVQGLHAPNENKPPFYDVLVIRSEVGVEKTLYFEITSFYGMPHSDAESQHYKELLLLKVMGAAKKSNKIRVLIRDPKLLVKCAT